jgi:hypothetical protein
MKKFYFLFLFTLSITCSFGQTQVVRSNSNPVVATDTKAGNETTGNSLSGENLFTSMSATTPNYIQRNGTNQLALVTNVEAPANATLTMHSIHGQLIVSKNINLVKGSNTIELPASNTPHIRIVSVYVGNQLMFTQKVY